MSEYYVYLHRRASDGSVFYVGKGKGKRAHETHNRNNYWKNIAAKHGHTVEIYRDGLSEPCAHSIERILIAAIGRDRLCNLTDGGEGCSGRAVSDNFIQIMTGDRNPMRNPIHAAKLAKAKTGKKRLDMTGSRHFAAKRVICVETRMEFETIANAERWLKSIGHEKARNTNIVKALKQGVRRYGFTWRYADNKNGGG